jgi:hypothetical protein
VIAFKLDETSEGLFVFHMKVVISFLYMTIRDKNLREDLLKLSRYLCQEQSYYHI